MATSSLCGHVGRAGHCFYTIFVRGQLAIKTHKAPEKSPGDLTALGRAKTEKHP